MCCNVEEASAATGNAISARAEEMAKAAGRQTRGDLGQDRGRDRADCRREDRARISWIQLGLEEPGLNRLIRAGYDLLGLLTFFTVGPKEARAWTVTKGSRRPRPRA